MRYFLDTEFIEDGKTIDLISIGIVAEDGREFYRENVECDFSKASEWVKANVMPHMGGVARMGFRREIAEAILKFVGTSSDKPEFWGYYADYDWVALCQLYGTMMDLPKGWPMFCMDIKQLCVSIGNPKLLKQAGAEHHALADARWNREVYEHLMRIQRGELKALPND